MKKLQHMMMQNAINQALTQGGLIREGLKRLSENSTLQTIHAHIYAPEEPLDIVGIWEDTYQGSDLEEHFAHVHHQWRMLAIFLADLHEDEAIDLVQLFFAYNTTNLFRLVRTVLDTMDFLEEQAQIDTF